MPRRDDSTDDQRAMQAAMWKEKHLGRRGPKANSALRGAEIDTRKEAAEKFCVTRKQVDKGTYILPRSSELAAEGGPATITDSCVAVAQ